MTLVVDASLVVAALVDTGREGDWARGLMASDELAAPHLLPVEVANVLRRSARVRDSSADVASLAHQELVAAEIELFPYAPLAGRIWDLRANLTPYDAWYVALAESLGASLATLDRKLARVTGVSCAFVTA